MNKAKIGLFGTCGGSTWRSGIMPLLDQRGISYFNPQVDNWTAECAQIEADHLVNDNIVLFPITDETTGIRSLAEIGFTVFRAQSSPDQRFVIYIMPTVDTTKVTEPMLVKESNRARTLVRAHLTKINLPNVMVVDSLESMFDVALSWAQT